MIKLILASCILILTACSPKSESLYLPPVQKLDQQVEDPNAVYFDPTVDILFVVDNSGSMGSHQTNLIRNIDLFVNAFLNNSILDYNIGVITTDMCDQGQASYCGGELVSSGGVTFVNRKTSNASSVLRRNLNLGIDGSGSEAVFGPVKAALSTNLNTTNKGFYRQNATLLTIFVTDAEDQSQRLDAVDLKNFLLNLKNGDAKKIISVGVIVPSNDTTNCPRDAWDKPKRIEQFLSFFPLAAGQTNELSLCSPTYGADLSAIANTVVNQIGRVIYLGRAPVMASLHVMYGNIELPSDYSTGWVYDSAKNAIILGDKINWSAQPSGSRIKVFYDAAKY